MTVRRVSATVLVFALVAALVPVPAAGADHGAVYAAADTMLTVEAPADAASDDGLDNEDAELPVLSGVRRRAAQGFTPERIALTGRSAPTEIPPELAS